VNAGLVPDPFLEQTSSATVMGAELIERHRVVTSSRTA
jgi:hypothetical protein